MAEHIIHILQTVICAGGLIVNTVLDIQKRQVSMVVAVIMGSSGFLWRLYTFTGFSRDIPLGLLPGAVCLLLAGLTGESIGYGDGWILLAIGISLGGEKMLPLCSVALFTAGICALVLIVFFHKDRKYQLPFVPFLLLGYLSTLLFTY